MSYQNKIKIILASGTFDLLHLGHVRYLEEAKKKGGENARLVVIVARDHTVEKRKGKKPVMNENQRKALVESLRVVDEAILGDKKFSIQKSIDKIKPSIIALGYDQTFLLAPLERYIAQKKINITVVQISRFGGNKLNSSSKIKKRIVENL
jgi:FAD synthetase